MCGMRISKQRQENLAKDEIWLRRTSALGSKEVRTRSGCVVFQGIARQLLQALPRGSETFNCLHVPCMTARSDEESKVGCIFASMSKRHPTNDSSRLLSVCFAFVADGAS